MKEYLIDINDFYDTWDNELIPAIKTYCTKQNKSFAEDRLISAKVCLLLIWYGVTIDEILKIKLSDVSYDGIKGFNITFDSRTLETFMEYKKMSGLNIDRGDILTYKDFKQNSFYRTTSNAEITDRTIRNAVNQLLTVGNEDKEIRDLYIPTTIYVNGGYCYVYEKLIQSGKTPKSKNIEEYAREFGYGFPAKNSLKNYTMQFKKYFKYRQEWEEQNPRQVEVEQNKQTDNVEVVTETSRASAEEVKELVDKIVNNTAPVEQIEVSKTEQSNAIEVCLDILNGLRTSISLMNNQIDTIESVLRNMKK